VAKLSVIIAVLSGRHFLSGKIVFEPLLWQKSSVTIAVLSAQHFLLVKIAFESLLWQSCL
jgi:hypothetical protein